MNELPIETLRRMAERLSDEDRDEMAIPSYLHKNPALRWMAWRRLHVTAARLAEVCEGRDRTKTTLLDYGCGTGVLFSEELKHATTVIGVDPVLAAARLLVEEQHLTGVTLLTPDEARAKVAPNSVDIIVAAEVLEHVEPLEPTLHQMREWLAPGGKLVISVPTESRAYRFGRRLAGFHGHYHHANAASIDRAIDKAGYRRLSKSTVPAPGPLAIYWILVYEP